MQGWMLGNAPSGLRELVAKCPELREINFLGCAFM